MQKIPSSSVADIITIKDLKIKTHIGVFEEERAELQHLLITITMTVDTKAAGESDDVSKSVDYQQVVNDIKKLAAEERKTLEKLAEDIAQCVLKRYNTSPVTVTVKKFILPETKHVAVSITRL